MLAVLLEREGIHIDAAKVREALHLVAERFTRAAREGEVWSDSREKSRAFWGEIYRSLLSKLGIPDVEPLAGRLYAEFLDLANYRLFPDVEGTLATLAGAGLRLGLVSNFEEWLERLLEQLGVARFFDVRVISGVEGIEKPNPAIFRLALDRM